MILCGAGCKIFSLVGLGIVHPLLLFILYALSQLLNCAYSLHAGAEAKASHHTQVSFILGCSFVVNKADLSARDLRQGQMTWQSGTLTEFTTVNRHHMHQVYALPRMQWVGQQQTEWLYFGVEVTKE
ncbi:hypothetical protein B0H10DRAFT_1939577 [Mycena sp. CBHHK59/15]|nr:hypothetical protein B0H10DRAFT_1939577 [Mycena sp. CBHHK59/15]